ncbi:MAG: YkvA family protein [Candidatus Limnocylindrales bacterium]
MSLDVLLAVVAAIVALWAALLVVFWLARPKGVPTRALVATIPDLVRLLRSLVTDPSVPLDVRIVLVGLIAWIVSPIDLIPEFIPGLGPIDDIVVAVAALRFVRRRVGLPELRARWRGSPEGFAIVAHLLGGEVGPGAGPGTGPE